MILSKGVARYHRRVLKAWQRSGYSLECYFARIQVKLTKKFGPMGGRDSDPPLGYAPDFKYESYRARILMNLRP